MLFDKVAGLGLARAKAALAAAMSGGAIAEPLQSTEARAMPPVAVVEAAEDDRSADSMMLATRASDLHAKAAAALDATTDALSELHAGLAGITLLAPRA